MDGKPRHGRRTLRPASWIQHSALLYQPALTLTCHCEPHVRRGNPGAASTVLPGVRCAKPQRLSAMATCSPVKVNGWWYYSSGSRVSVGNPAACQPSTPSGNHPARTPSAAARRAAFQLIQQSFRQKKTTTRPGSPPVSARRRAANRTSTSAGKAPRPTSGSHTAPGRVRCGCGSQGEPGRMASGRRGAGSTSTSNAPPWASRACMSRTCSTTPPGTLSGTGAR